MMKINIKKKFILIFFVLITFYVYAAQPELKKEKINIKMSDGTELASDMYSPEGADKLPVILIRSPYGKEQYYKIAKALVENDYIVISQDVRGTGESGGINIAFVNEAKDGFETLQWISIQKWYNGKIGMWGASYCAYCADIIASLNTGLLNSVFSISGGTNLGKSLMPGGAFHLMMNMTWLHFSKIHQDSSLNKYKSADLMNVIPLINGFSMIGADKDINEIGHFIGSLANTETPQNTAFLHMTGWYDFFNVLTFDLYDEIKSNKGITNKIIIGPWYHDQIYRDNSKVGDEDFGSEALMGLKNLTPIIIQWFDYTLKGKQNEIANQKDVNVFVMNKNRWEQYDELPPLNSEEHNLYFSSSGSANSSKGNGVLKTINDYITNSDSYIFDPLNPVPTYGGANFHFFPDNLGVKDQSKIEERNDVLVYTSEALNESRKIIGNIKIELYASTEGVSTDFTAKLVEVQQNGYCKIICDGIKRISKTTPGKIFMIEIELGYTAIEILKGNKIRVEISSSNFPKYDRNPNTGANPLFAEEFNKVKQTIYYGNEYPSKLTFRFVK